MNKLPIQLTVLTVLLISMLLAACGMSSTGTTPTPGSTAGANKESASTRLVAEGEVVPGKYVNLSFPTNGTVGEVLVKEGEPVKSGDVIVRLDGIGRLKSAVSSAVVEVVDSQRALDELYKMADVNKATMQLAVAQAETNYKNAKDHRMSKDFLSATQEQIDHAYAEYILAIEKVKDLEEDFNDHYGDKPDSDYGRANAYYQLALAKDKRDKAKDKWIELKDKPDIYQVNVTQAQVDATEAALNKAKADFAKLQNGIDPDKLALAEARQKNAKAQVEAARTSLVDAEIKAGFDGSVISNTFKIGETVGPGIGSVAVADLTSWEIETTDLTELEVVKLREGSDATIALDALPDTELTGKVKEIQNLGVNKQGDITYKVTIALDQIDERLLWKMTAVVTFVVGKED